MSRNTSWYGWSHQGIEDDPIIFNSIYGNLHQRCALVFLSKSVTTRQRRVLVFPLLDMADSQDATAPRRSQRDRKMVQHFVSSACELYLSLLCFTAQPAGSQSPNKRKRPTDDDELTDLSELDELERNRNEDDVDADVEGDSDGEPDFGAPKHKQKAAATTRKGKPKAKGPPPQKRPRAAKSTGIKTTRATKETRLKPHKPKAVNGEFNITKLTSEARISADNPLFSAWSGPSQISVH